MKRLLLTCTDLMAIQFLVPHMKYLSEHGFSVELACSEVGGRLQELRTVLSGIAPVHTVRLVRNPFSLRNRKGLSDLKKIINGRGMSTAVGDEGGFAPNIDSHEEAIELIIEAIKAAGYEPGKDIAIGLDCAASEFYEDGKYVQKGQGKTYTAEEWIKVLEGWVAKYPIISIEDGMAEVDWEGWKKLTDALGRRVQLVGDDLFVTNPKILAEGIQKGVANSILIKVNQIGSLSETLAAIEMAKRAGYSVVVSHRSGETEDSFIADLAVGVNAGQIKTGSMSRSDRMAKYNQLLRIEEELDDQAVYPGRDAFYCIKEWSF